MKILLLEDTHLFAEAIQENLQSIGYEVIWKETPDEAIIEMKSETPPDLCLFDMRIEGKKLTGLDVVERLKKELGKPIPAIIYTSYDVNNYAHQARAAGVPLQFLVDRSRIDSSVFVEQLIEEAASYYGPPVTEPNEHLYYQSRKVGICVNTDEAREYLFVSKDEIMFIQSEDRKTRVHLFLQIRGRATEREAKSILMATNVGQVGKQIHRNFPNFVRISQSFWINLEQISGMEGLTLYFSSGDHVNIGKEGRARLMQLNVMILAK